MVINANRTSNIATISNRKSFVYTSHDRECNWNKGTRYVPAYLIAVHEEAGDGGAHAQLIAEDQESLGGRWMTAPQ
jgi:hypothetical protein